MRKRSGGATLAIALATCLLLGGLRAPGAVADELDRLVQEVKPPARSKDYRPRFTIRLTDQVAHSGHKSLEVKGVPYEKITSTFPSKEVPPARFDPNARYHLECWIKVAGADTEAWVSIHMIGQTRDQSTIGRFRSASVAAGDWQKAAYEFTVPPDGLAVILGFVCLGPGTAYFDDFKLEELGQAAAP